MTPMPMKILMDLEGKYLILKKYILILEVVTLWQVGRFLWRKQKHVFVKCLGRNVKKGQINEFSSPRIPLITSDPFIAEWLDSFQNRT